MTAAVPPIGSIFLALLVILLIFRRRLIPNFDDDRVLALPSGFHMGDLSEPTMESSPEKEKPKLKFGFGLTCEEIMNQIDELNSEKETEDFLFKSAKDLSAESLKILLDCRIPIVHILNEFADWSNFKLNYPDLYEDSKESVEINDMTTWALKSFPIEDLVRKLNSLNDETLLNKLPTKNILNFLIQSVSDHFVYWRLFTETCFKFLEPENRILVMRYFALVSKIELGQEDLLLLFARSETFFLFQLNLFKDTDEEADDDEYILGFSQIELFLEHFLVGRGCEILRVPLSAELKEALKHISIGSIDGEGLTNFICRERPVDPMANFYDPLKPSTPIKDGLFTIFMIEDLFKREVSFTELIERFQIKSPINILEILRTYSNDADEILMISQRYGAVYEESFHVLEWIKKTFKLGNPPIMNFYFSTYEPLIKYNDLRMMLDEMNSNFDAINFYLNCESLMLRMALLQPKTKPFFVFLTIDFVDSNDKFELLTHDEALSLTKTDRNTPEEREIFDSATKKVNLNKKLKEFMRESFNFHLQNLNKMNFHGISVSFLEMDGQDAGGLARHFVSVCLRLLAEEHFGFFHFCNGKYVPRTLLDSRILGFLAMLHGQCVDLQIKMPWMIDFEIESLPIKLCDLINEISEVKDNNERWVPSFEDLVEYLRKYTLLEDKFDLSPLNPVKIADEGYFEALRGLEAKYWDAGFRAYKLNLINSLGRSIVKDLKGDTLIEEVWEMLRPKSSSEVSLEEFMMCFDVSHGSGDLAKEAIKLALQSDPRALIPLTIKFITGSPELPPGGLSTLRIALKTCTSEKWSDRRLPQTSTCAKTVYWRTGRGESVEELAERFLMAINECRGYELK